MRRPFKARGASNTRLCSSFDTDDRAQAQRTRSLMLPQEHFMKRPESKPWLRMPSD
jgi:hypothetical protein